MFQELTKIKDGDSRAITAENPKGEKAKGGTADGVLGKSRKGSPCISIKAGETVTIAEINSTGIVNHIWCTVTD